MDYSEIADAIVDGDKSRYREWLAQEAGDLALRIANFDLISPLAVLPLARISAYGEADIEQLAEGCGMDPADLQYHLAALSEFGFVEESDSGFDVTPLGMRAFIAIGRNMIIRERYELKRRFEALDRVFRKMNAHAQ